ncbi:MAG: DUF1289 domain-containing protein [Hyphomicrobiaceae bacterium]|nr:DUF1289 domain-containing protein [Hyphomicrobiaceae bacterium]
MTIDTPCVNVCVIDQVTRLCAGCGRTIEEIASWRTLSAADRRRIMDDLPRRRRAQQAAED